MPGDAGHVLVGSDVVRIVVQRQRGLTKIRVQDNTQECVATSWVRRKPDNH